jgi:hypothetical protein
MSEVIEALKELIEMGVLEAARDEVGNVIRRNGEIVWAAVPDERLTEEQKAYVELLRCETELN